MRRIRFRRHVFIGGLLGAIAGAIVAVNVVITAGISYESTLVEVFRQNALVGVLAVVILVAGPIVGALTARAMRRPPHR